ncbi:DUF3592 domain-containing protein [Myxococcaceae bacterium GXIMD 01537]
MRTSRGLSSLPLLVLLPWSLLVLLVDVMALRSVVQQVRTLGYVPAAGTITLSDTKISRGSKGSTSIDFVVGYSYAVEGREYEGTRFRYPRWSYTGSRAEGLTQRYPVGAAVQVHHPPGRPEEAVLEAGVRGGDLFVFTILLPFNLVSLWGVYAWRRGARLARSPEAFSREGRLHVTLAAGSPFLYGAFTSGLCAFFTYAIAGNVWSLDPPLGVTFALFAGVLLVGLAAGWARRARLGTGRYDLVLDPQARTLSLPPVDGRKERVDVPWAHIQAIKVRTQTFVHGGRRGNTRTSHCPTLEVATPQGTFREETLVDWGDEERAQALVEWLRAEVLRGEPEARRARAAVSAP